MRRMRSAETHAAIGRAFDALSQPLPATHYTCVCCGKRHTSEFSLTCPACDRERESGALDLPKEYR